MKLSLWLRQISAGLPEQLTAVGVILVIDCFLQNTAEMKGQPAEGENQDETEHRLGHFPPLKQKHKENNLDCPGCFGQSILLPMSSAGNLHVYLLHVVVERDAHAFFATEHLTGHECVEDSRASQWKAEIEAKEPPVFNFLVEL